METKSTVTNDFTPLYLVLALFIALAFAIAYFFERIKVQKTSKELKAEKSRFHVLVNAVPCTISWVSSDLKYLAANKQLANLVGIKPEEFAGKSIGFMGQNPGSVEFIKSIFVGNEEQRRYEFSVGTGDRAHHILCIAKRYNDGKEATIIGVDITELRRHEKTILEQQQALISSAKLSSLGEMAGAIGHEINNPLTLIIGYVEDLRRKMNRKPMDKMKINLTLEKLEKTTWRIAKIVKGLKSFAREGDADPFQEVSAKSILEDTLELCSQRFKHHDVDLIVCEFPLPITFDCQKTQFEQVVLNILNNAFDAVVDLSEKWVKINVSCDPNTVWLTITDSGPGISKEIVDKIHQPFFTTKIVGKGTGLGLSISKGIIEQHGGHLCVDQSSPNTKFVIELPRYHKNQYEKKPA